MAERVGLRVSARACKDKAHDVLANQGGEEGEREVGVRLDVVGMGVEGHRVRMERGVMGSAGILQSCTYVRIREGWDASVHTRDHFSMRVG